MDQQISILIVEQDSDTREVLRDLLEGEGYFTFAAASAREGTKHLAQSKVPCIVLLNRIKTPKTGLEFVLMVEHESYLLNIARDVMTAAQNDFTVDVANAVEERVSASDAVAERMAFQQAAVRKMRAQRQPERQQATA